MGKLRKYEIDAVVGEIQSKLRKNPKDLSVYSTQVKTVQKYEDKIKKLQEKIKEINNLKNEYLSSLGCSSYFSSINLAVELYRLDNKTPSNIELERQVILSDSSELNEIVSNILKQYE